MDQQKNIRCIFPDLVGIHPHTHTHILKFICVINFHPHASRHTRIFTCACTWGKGMCRIHCHMHMHIHGHKQCALAPACAVAFLSAFACGCKKCECMRSCKCIGVCVCRVKHAHTHVEIFIPVSMHNHIDPWHVRINVLVYEYIRLHMRMACVFAFAFARTRVAAYASHSGKCICFVADQIFWLAEEWAYENAGALAIVFGRVYAYVHMHEGKCPRILVHTCRWTNIFALSPHGTRVYKYKREDTPARRDKHDIHVSAYVNYGKT